MSIQSRPTITGYRRGGNGDKFEITFFLSDGTEFTPKSLMEAEICWPDPSSVKLVPRKGMTNKQVLKEAKRFYEIWPPEWSHLTVTMEVLP